MHKFHEGLFPVNSQLNRSYPDRHLVYRRENSLPMKGSRQCLEIIPATPKIYVSAGDSLPIVANDSISLRPQGDGLSPDERATLGKAGDYLRKLRGRKPRRRML